MFDGWSYCCGGGNRVKRTGFRGLHHIYWVGLEDIRVICQGCESEEKRREIVWNFPKG